jgi:hypothetical protein
MNVGTNFSRAIRSVQLVAPDTLALNDDQERMTVDGGEAKPSIPAAANDSRGAIPGVDFIPRLRYDPSRNGGINGNENVPNLWRDEASDFVLADGQSQVSEPEARNLQNMWCGQDTTLPSGTSRNAAETSKNAERMVSPE